MSKDDIAPRGVRALVIRLFAKSHYDAHLRADHFEAEAEEFRGRYEAASLQLASVRSELDSLKKTVRSELKVLKLRNKDASKVLVAAQAVAEHAKKRPTKSPAEKRLIVTLSSIKALPTKSTRSGQKR